MLFAPSLCPYSKKERRELAERYGMAAHIQVILRLVSEYPQFPASTDRWSFAARVHPAVRLALFYAE